MANQTEERSIAEENMIDYFKTHDVQYVAEGAVFTSMNTGEETKGRNAIAKMLHHIYHVAFDAYAVINHSLVTDTKAVIEATFIGKHIGEFAGIPATNREVNVPLCVSYNLNEDGLIEGALIYMVGDVLMHQLTSE